MTRYEISIPRTNLVGYIYNSAIYPDKWCFELGGCYNWFLPFDECVRKAEEQMIRIATQRIQREFKGFRRKHHIKKKQGI